MENYESSEYFDCKCVIKSFIDDGYGWDQIKDVCVEKENAANALEDLKIDENLPENLTLETWRGLVDYMAESVIPISQKLGFDDGNTYNDLPVPQGKGSAYEGGRSVPSSLRPASPRSGCSDPVPRR